MDDRHARFESAVHRHIHYHRGYAVSSPSLMARAVTDPIVMPKVECWTITKADVWYQEQPNEVSGYVVASVVREGIKETPWIIGVPFAFPVDYEAEMHRILQEIHHQFFTASGVYQELQAKMDWYEAAVIFRRHVPWAAPNGYLPQLSHHEDVVLTLLKLAMALHSVGITPIRIDVEERTYNAGVVAVVIDSTQYNERIRLVFEYLDSLTTCPNPQVQIIVKRDDIPPVHPRSL
jgi:hypothetical protein